MTSKGLAMINWSWVPVTGEYGVYRVDEWVPPTDEEREMFRKIALDAIESKSDGDMCTKQDDYWHWFTFARTKGEEYDPNTHVSCGLRYDDMAAIAESLSMDGM